MVVTISTQAPSATVDETCITIAARDAISYFLDKACMTIPTVRRDLDLEARVQTTIQSWGLEGEIHPHEITATIIAATAYNHISDFDTKVQIALYTSLLTSMDHPEIMGSLPFDRLHDKLFAGTLQTESDMFGHLSRILMGMWNHYPRFAASSILRSTLQYINVTILENETRNAVLSTQALSFVEYRRDSSGISDAYASFIWEKSRFPDVQVYIRVLPDVGKYINYVNDILSFYKEELAGETGNYIHDRATISRKTAHETLHEVIDETVDALCRVRDVLGEGEARDAWENFARGYIGFHTGSPRYRLQEIIECQYMTD
ncbi:isoprenoid synthase domain-containing protein [Amylocystis lapponica]|nr:isoprenoid synthase domain-containing protein [Amylocystis lapponica]